ncbi:MAG: DUF4349 domain-containing protein [Acidobacteria bacterium]|nr:DUF4349 domain-containing protein [Acidobacteriota bacterium]
MDWTFGIGCDFSYESSTPPNLIPQVSPPKSPVPTPLNASTNPPETPTTTAPALPRKIVRHGKLTLELDNPAAGQQQIAAIVAAHQGFVITSEFSHFNNAQANQEVTITVRVPATQFDDTLAAVHAVGARLVFENLSGEDVTEEFLDLQARRRTQQALEEQLLQLMKKTTSVSSAMEVQREITNVRTEIEKLIGRSQYLENQAALSTITVLLQTPAAIVAASTYGIGDKISRAFADGIHIAVGITLLLLRLLFAAIPLLLFVVYPFRLARKRFSKRQLTRSATADIPPTEAEKG